MLYVRGMQTFVRTLVYGGIMLAMIASRGQLPRNAPSVGDWIFIFLTIALLAWCTSDRAGQQTGQNAGDVLTSIDAEGHEQARKGIAFRLGKALNGVRRRLRSGLGATRRNRVQ